MAAPPAEILRAFGIHETPFQIPGGQNLCYRAGDFILKPSGDIAESQWVSQLFRQLPISSEYSFPLPKEVLNAPGQFVANGWTASSFVAGTSCPKKHIADILGVCRAFHNDLGKLGLGKPRFLSSRSNRWQEADLVTWDEKALTQVENVNEDLLVYFDSVLGTLRSMMQPLPSDVRDQLIHGDMTGNVLFEDGEPPNIIDFTPYWRPAEYASAIVVADGLAWHDKGEELIKMYGTDHVRMQLLIRALYWRCLTLTIDSDMDWLRTHLPNADYKGATNVLRESIEKIHLNTAGT